MEEYKNEINIDELPVEEESNNVFDFAKEKEIRKINKTQLIFIKKSGLTINPDLNILGFIITTLFHYNLQKSFYYLKIFLQTTLYFYQENMKITD